MHAIWPATVGVLILAACSPNSAPVASASRPAPSVPTPACHTPEPESAATCEEGKFSSESLGEFECGGVNLSVVRFTVEFPHSMTGVHFRSGGKTASPSIMSDGAFHSLCRQGRFLLVPDAVHFGGPSFVMAGDGRVIASHDLGETPSIGVSVDNRIFWAQTHEAADGRPDTRLRVFDSEGKPLLDRRFTEPAGALTVTHRGVEYSIAIENPDLPG